MHLATLARLIPPLVEPNPYMLRLILPFLLAASVYGYWKYLASAPAELRKQRIQKVVTWAVFAITVAAAVRSGSLLWLIGTGVVMVVMRYLAHLGGERRAASSEGGSTHPGSAFKPEMTRAEALQIFELGDNPSFDSIQKRYRELMRTVHPDRGGSNYLAAKLNEAYQVLTAGQHQ